MVKLIISIWHHKRLLMIVKKCVQRASWLYTISRRKKSVFVWSQRRVLRVMVSMTRLLFWTWHNWTIAINYQRFLSFNSCEKFCKCWPRKRGWEERFPLWDFCGFSWNLRWSPTWWFTDSYLKKLTRKLRLASCDELNPSVTSDRSQRFFRFMTRSEFFIVALISFESRAWMDRENPSRQTILSSTFLGGTFDFFSIYCCCSASLWKNAARLAVFNLAHIKGVENQEKPAPRIDENAHRRQCSTVMHHKTAFNCILKMISHPFCWQFLKKRIWRWKGKW